MFRTLTRGILAGFIVLAVHSPNSAADCTIDQSTCTDHGFSANVGPSPDIIGQSFTACQTGVVTSVTFNANLVTPGLTLGLEVGTNICAPSYTQSVSAVQGSNTVVLDTPFPVTDGAVYSFGLQPSGGHSPLMLWGCGEDVYAGGIYCLCGAGHVFVPYPQFDLAFTVQITTEPTPTRANTWGSVKDLYR